jgi:hypothetical protein
VGQPDSTLEGIFGDFITSGAVGNGTKAGGAFLMTIAIIRQLNRQTTARKSMNISGLGKVTSERTAPREAGAASRAYPRLRSFFSMKATTFFTEPKLSFITSSSSTVMLNRC